MKKALEAQSTEILRLTSVILQQTSISTDDGVRTREPIAQTTDFAQGDNFSLLLFSVLLNDLPATITKKHTQIDILLYADDVSCGGRAASIFLEPLRQWTIMLTTLASS